MTGRFALVEGRERPEERKGAEIEEKEAPTQLQITDITRKGIVRDVILTADKYEVPQSSSS